VRWLVLWLALLGVYCGTLGIRTTDASVYGGVEPRFLMTAESLVSDQDIDLTNQYAQRADAAFVGPGERLSVGGRPTDGRVHEPHGVGFALLIAPAYALAGATGVEILLAAVAALAFVLAAALARQLVPEPWATSGVALVALSPPVLAHGTAVGPELMAGALLAGAALATLRARKAPQARFVFGGALALALVPWLASFLLLPAAVVAVALVRWTARRGRKVAALYAAEVIFASLVAWVTVNDVLFGGFTPEAAGEPGEPATGAETASEYLARLPRVVSLSLDRDVGLLRWAPVLALTFVAAWLLWRSRRERLAVLLPERLDVELAAALLLAVCGAQVLVAVLAVPSVTGDWFAGHHLIAALPCAAALTAWGLRHTPRIGGALGALTLVASGWLLVALRTSPTASWSAPGSAAPWGPANALLPDLGPGSAGASMAAVAAAVVLASLVAREWWRLRRPRPALGS
jgi:hypothetical protein